MNTDDLYEKVCYSLDDTKKLAKSFAEVIKNGCFVNLYGEIGAGKTAFVKFVAEALGIEEHVTSPSFVILNEYHSGKVPMYHFDLYRLENEGVKTIVDELHEYSEGQKITFVEWAEFSQDEIPIEHVKINVTYETSEGAEGAEAEGAEVAGAAGADGAEAAEADVRKYSFSQFGNGDAVRRLRETVGV